MMPTLDQKANDVFAGKVVRKDLVRKVKVGANVPVYVLEYLLGKYCATDDPAAIQAGLRLVHFQFSENFIRPDEANKAMFEVKDKGHKTLLDKIRVRSTEREEWGEMANFGNRFLHVPDHLLRQFPRLLEGGIWAHISLEYRMDEDEDTPKMGLIGLWDVVAFDEVAGIEFSDKTAVQILKDYMESGSFSRGREELAAEASMVYLGNINQPVDVLVRTSHLFAPLPDAMGDDMAFIDRLHYYLPGWEVPKMSTDLLTEGYGFVVDYLAEALRDLRRQNFTDMIDAHFSLGAHLNARDAKAVRKTVSGLIKLLHPNRAVTVEELRGYLELALEGRRRVKEQLKKLGAFEYYQTSFSYLVNESMQEHFVGVPEGGGRGLISADPLPPGSVYAVTLTDEDKVVLHRIEVGKIAGGSGKMRIAGTVDSATRASLTTAFDYLRARRRELGIDRELDTYDYHVQAVDLSGSGERVRAGIAFFIAVYSALKERGVRSALVVLGDLTIQGNVLAARSLVEPLQVAMDNGAKRALIPVENKRSFLEVAADIVERVDPIFYGEPLAAALKALGVE